MLSRNDRSRWLVLLFVLLAAGCSSGQSVQEDNSKTSGDGGTAGSQATPVSLGPVPDEVELALNWLPEAEHGGFLQPETDSERCHELTIPDKLQHRASLGKFAQAFNIRISLITGKQVEDYIRALGVAGRTQNNFRQLINTLFRFAVKRGYLPKDHDEMNAVELADNDNGENLLLIADRRVATTYAIEAIRLFDHYEFRVKQLNAATAATELVLHKPPRVAGELPWFDEDYTVASKIMDRKLFA